MNATRKHRTLRSAHKSAEALSPVQIADKYRARCYRSGKTAKDHRNGNPKRNHDRKLARATWQKEHSSHRGTEPVKAFPV